MDYVPVLLRVPIVCRRYRQKTSRSSSSFQLWIVAIGSASIAPKAAPSVSESSSESRLRLVWGRGALFIDSSLHVPYFGRAEKEYRNRRVVQLQALGLDCSPSCPARLPRFSPRVLNRAEAPSLPCGYRCRAFNRLDGCTARRVTPLHRPAGLTSTVGRNVPKYVAVPPASPGGQAGQSCGGLSPDFRDGRTGPRPRREAAGEHTLYALLMRIGIRRLRGASARCKCAQWLSQAMCSGFLVIRPE